MGPESIEYWMKHAERYAMKAEKLESVLHDARVALVSIASFEVEAKFMGVGVSSTARTAIQKIDEVLYDSKTKS